MVLIKLGPRICWLLIRATVTGKVVRFACTNHPQLSGQYPTREWSKSVTDIVTHIQFSEYKNAHFIIDLNEHRFLNGCTTKRQKTATI